MVLVRAKGRDHGYATGEARELPLRPAFDRRIKLEFHGAKVTSDGGLLAYRELDDALGLTDMAITQLLDGGRGKNTRHKLSGLFRQAMFGRLAGYEDVNDAERLARDPAMRAIVGREVSIVRQRPAARWGASRPGGWRPTPTWRCLRICPEPRLTGCMHGSRPKVSSRHG
jgi:Transposase DDE domain group 1